MTKKQSNKFLTDTTEYLLSVGATVVSNRSHEMELNTIVGKLKIIRIDTRGELYSIFCRFDDVEKAKQITSCNPYSGKYNLHIADRKNETEIENWIKAHFDFLIP